MTRSPLIFSISLIASLSLLGSNAAWSAQESQETPKPAATAKAKPIKGKVKKSTKLKAGKIKKAAPRTLASATPVKPPSEPTGVVSTNPYLASQPLAILPKAVNPYLATQTVAAPVIAAPIIAAPVLAAPDIATPSAPAAAATVAKQAQSAVVAAAPVVVAAAPLGAPVAAYQPISLAPIAKNQYLVYQQQYAQPAAAAVPPQAANPTPWSSNAGDAAMPNPAQSAIADATNSFNLMFTSLKMALPTFPQPVVAPSQTAIAGTSNSFNQIFTSLKMLLPSNPLSGDTTFLPVIKTVYPTGEKPLVVLNFKCPTEMIGITPPPMKLLHEAINLGFDGLNKTNLLSFNLQQVCS